MTRQTDEKSLYEQQEDRILAQSDAFISLLTKRGILGDHKIDNDKIRKAQQEKNRKSYHNTQLLLQHYRNIAWLLECLPMDTEDETEFTEERAVLTAKSDAEGIFFFDDVRFGKWIVKELAPAEGFVANDTVFPIDVTTDGAVIEIEAENRHIYGMVHTTSNKGTG